LQVANGKTTKYSLEQPKDLILSSHTKMLEKRGVSCLSFGLLKYFKTTKFTIPLKKSQNS
jgi:hypothetical protein